jgi:glycosyltransferase involved in cell wall biosynthesis
VGLRFSIDSAQTRDGLLMGWGWYLSDDAGNASIDLELCFSDGERQIVPCLIRRSREDVLQAHPTNPNALAAGFIFLSKLDSSSNVASTKLIASLKNGQSLTHPLAGFPEKFSPDSLAPQVVLTRLQIAWRLARAGRFRYVLKRIKQEWMSRSKGTKASEVTNQLSMEEQEIFIDHQLGGGANKYTRERIDALLQTGKGAIRVVFDLPRLQYRLDMHQPSGVQSEVFETLGTLRDYLSQIHFAKIHVNNLVSYPDPIAMLQFIGDLRVHSGSQLFIYLHDFFPVCPSYTLIDAQARYCSVPDEETCRRCLKTNEAIFPSFIRLKEITPWRESWRRMLESATQIVAFSGSTVDIFERAFPANGTLANIVVQPHSVDVSRYPKLTPLMGPPLRVGVIGNISFAKGASVVQALLELIAQKHLDIEIVVFGTIERLKSYPEVTITGPFENSLLPNLLVDYGIGVCLLPSICPETFSYVTEEIITMEMPLVCFDLGAPASRVRRYSYGEVAKSADAQGALDAIRVLANRITT